VKDKLQQCPYIKHSECNPKQQNVHIFTKNLSKLASKVVVERTTLFPIAKVLSSNLARRYAVVTKDNVVLSNLYIHMMGACGSVVVNATSRKVAGSRPFRPHYALWGLLSL
jgi:hypothetical protein